MSQQQPKTSPLVSVIVPSYNYARFIGQALESLRAQTYTNWECMVVDDGSTDNTAEVITSYSERDPRIKYLRQQNQYQAAARNLGLSQSRGQYVQFLDADDSIEPRKLERHVAYLEQHSEVDIVYSGVRFFEGGLDNHALIATDDAPTKPPQVSGEGLEVLPALVRANIMVVNSPLVRRSLVEAVGPFDKDLTPAEDWDYWLRCALAGARFCFIEEPGTLALVRMHQTSSSANLVRMYRAMVAVRNKLDGQLKDPQLRACNREGKSAEEGYLGVEMITAGQSLRGAGHIFRAAALARPAKWRAKWLWCALAGPFVPGRLKMMMASPLTETFRSARKTSLT